MLIRKYKKDHFFAATTLFSTPEKILGIRHAGTGVLYPWPITNVEVCVWLGGQVPCSLCTHTHHNLTTLFNPKLLDFLGSILLQVFNIEDYTVCSIWSVNHNCWIFNWKFLRVYTGRKPGKQHHRHEAFHSSPPPSPPPPPACTHIPVSIPNTSWG